MVRDTDGGVADNLVQVQPEVLAPPMLRQPVDRPQPLARVSDIDAIRTLRNERAARLNITQTPRSVRTRVRAWAGRVSGRADRRLMRALVDAIDALAAHSDAIADRVNLQLDRDTDVTAAFGQEISLLRAEVIHVREVVNAPERHGG